MAEVPSVTPTATGSLAKTPFAHVLVYLHVREMSGTLEITLGERHEHVYFQKGCPAKVRSSEPSDPLGRVLLDLGLIDETTYQRSTETVAKGQGLQGQILLSMGSIQMPALIRGLKEQLTRKLLRLFPLSTADYAYYDGVNFLRGYGGDEVLRIDPLPVLYTGVRSSYDDARLEALLGPVGLQRLRLLPTADFRRFALGAEEVELCTRSTTQAMTVEEIVRASSLPSFQTRSLLYCLLITKQVEFVAPESATSPGVLKAPLPAAAMPVSPVETRPPTPIPVSRRKSKPVISAQPAADPELEARRREIIARAEKIEVQSYFQMLAVSKDATPENVRDVYFKMAKVYHPDRALAGLSDLKETLEYIFSNLTEAYLTLTDKEKRTRYQSLLKEGGGTLADQKKIQSVVDAAMNFQKAEVCLRRKDYAEAERLCALALAAHPDDPEYQALSAWIQFHVRPPTDRIDDLIELLKRAQSHAKESEKTNFYLATALKRAGFEPQAIVHFRKASSANPRNVDALREIRLFEMRKERSASAKSGKKEDGGIFGKFFKK